MYCNIRINFKDLQNLFPGITQDNLESWRVLSRFRLYKITKQTEDRIYFEKKVEACCRNCVECLDLKEEYQILFERIFICCY